MGAIHEPSEGYKYQLGEGTMNQGERVQYTAQVDAIGGRDDGAASSSDERLDLKFSLPGASANGTNPEQLLAACWSACFLSSIKIVAGKWRVRLPSEMAVHTEVDLCKNDDDFFLEARINVHLPEMDSEVAMALADDAEKICPYSKATHGNINVALSVTTAQARIGAIGNGAEAGTYWLRPDRGVRSDHSPNGRETHA